MRLADLMTSFTGYVGQAMVLGSLYLSFKKPFGKINDTFLQEHFMAIIGGLLVVMSVFSPLRFWIEALIKENVDRQHATVGDMLMTQLLWTGVMLILFAVISFIEALDNKEMANKYRAEEMNTLARNVFITGAISCALGIFLLVMTVPIVHDLIT